MSKIDIGKLRYRGFSLVENARNKRNKLLVSSYVSGIPATKLTSSDEHEIKSVSGVYNVVSAQHGFYRYPMIERGITGRGMVIEKKKVLKKILKLKKKGLTFNEIADKLNKKNIKTITGKDFKGFNVSHKYYKHLYSK